MKDSDLTRYKNSISNIPTYSKEEEKVIFEKFNKNKNDINLRNEIIKHNLKLVTSVVYKYSNNKNSISDLISYGNEGLIYAVDHFDPTLDISFSPPLKFREFCLFRGISPVFQLLQPSKKAAHPFLGI